jgi:LuxR family transcriptional regulator, quorum-sensing system regulator BjaR1
MSNSAPELDQSVFGFIDALPGLSDPAAIVDALHRALTPEGVRFFCFNFLPQPGESFADVVLANHWPQDWLSLYVAENYVQDDPAIRYCRRVAQPFEWSAAPFDPMREPRAAEIVERAKDFGLADGYVTPVPSPSGFARQRMGRRPTRIRRARESRDPSHVTLRVRSITRAECAV